MTDPISIALAIYVAGMALWFLAAGWSDLVSDWPPWYIAALGVLWPCVVFMYTFLVTGAVTRAAVKKLTERNI